MSSEKEEVRRLDKAIRVFGIWLRGEKTYVSREEAEHAYRTAIDHLNKERSRLCKTMADNKASEPDYKALWELLSQRVDAELLEAKDEDETDAYNGLYGGRAFKWEMFKKMMKECVKDVGNSGGRK